MYYVQRVTQLSCLIGLVTHKDFFAWHERKNPALHIDIKTNSTCSLYSSPDLNHYTSLNHLIVNPQIWTPKAQLLSMEVFHLVFFFPSPITLLFMFIISGMKSAAAQTWFILQIELMDNCWQQNCSYLKKKILNLSNWSHFLVPKTPGV